VPVQEEILGLLMPFLSAFPKRRVRLFEIYARVLERLADTRRGFDHLSVGSGVNPKPKLRV